MQWSLIFRLPAIVLSVLLQNFDLQSVISGQNQPIGEKPPVVIGDRHFSCGLADCEYYARAYTKLLR
jgi:hypothetical protein